MGVDYIFPQCGSSQGPSLVWEIWQQVPIPSKLSSEPQILQLKIVEICVSIYNRVGNITHHQSVDSSTKL